jgi:hypothetical protein
MLKIFEFAPIVAPILGAIMVYVYRKRLEKGVMALTVSAVVLALVSAGVNVIGDKLMFTGQETFHRTEASRALVSNAAFGGAWLLLAVAAAKDRRGIKND